MEAGTVGGGVIRNTVSATLSAFAGEDSFTKSVLRVGRKDDLKRNEQKLSTRRRRCCGWV